MRVCVCMLALAILACGDDVSPDVDASDPPFADASAGVDAMGGSVDAGRELSDGGAGVDAALIDAAVIDAAVIDAAVIDAAVIDAAVIDAAVIDAAVIDAAVIDAAVIDAPSNSVMSFFVTSTGSGANGGNLGGLAGADAKCQSLGVAGGAGSKTWRAYLSTGATGPGPIVNARDRIGAGPWANQQGVQVAADLASLHSNGILGNLVLDELGAVVPGTEHDILTGTAVDGTLHDDSTTCNNWTDGTVNTQGQVGHCDTVLNDGESWNSIHSGSCDEAALNGNAGSGRLYCFASN